MLFKKNGTPEIVTEDGYIKFHSGGGRLEVSCRYLNKALIMRIRDSLAKVDHRFCLSDSNYSVFKEYLDKVFDYEWDEEKATPTKGMNFRDTWPHLLNGKKIKLPTWEGYWVWENNTIMMHCADGTILDIRETDNPAFTFTNVASDEWEVVE